MQTLGSQQDLCGSDLGGPLAVFTLEISDGEFSQSRPNLSRDFRTIENQTVPRVRILLGPPTNFQNAR